MDQVRSFGLSSIPYQCAPRSSVKIAQAIGVAAFTALSWLTALLLKDTFPVASCIATFLPVLPIFALFIKSVHSSSSTSFAFPRVVISQNDRQFAGPIPEMGGFHNLRRTANPYSDSNPPPFSPESDEYKSFLGANYPFVSLRNERGVARPNNFRSELRELSGLNRRGPQSVTRGNAPGPFHNLREES
jgi:hypothetical protein